MKRILALSTLVMFVAIAILGLRTSMVTDRNGSMSNCPLMNGMSSICRMNVFEHMATWQSLFATTAPTVVLLLVGLTLLVGSSLLNFNRLHFLGDKFLHYQRRDFISQLFDPLRIAFSRGILNPKIYSFSD